MIEGTQDILAESVLSIRGATVRDLGLDGDEPLPETPEAAKEYLAEHLKVADALSTELDRRTHERMQRIEGDAKN